jgi:hypothetical protein
LSRVPPRRALPERQGPPPPQSAASDVPQGTLPAERLLALRRRLRARVHDSPEVIDEMLRRMVQSRDL